MSIMDSETYLASLTIIGHPHLKILRILDRVLIKAHGCTIRNCPSLQSLSLDSLTISDLPLCSEDFRLQIANCRALKLVYIGDITSSIISNLELLSIIGEDLLKRSSWITTFIRWK